MGAFVFDVVKMTIGQCSIGCVSPVAPAKCDAAYSIVPNNSM